MECMAGNCATMLQSSSSIAPTIAPPTVVQTPVDTGRAQPLERQCGNDLATMTNARIEYLTEALNVTLFRQERMGDNEQERRAAVTDGPDWLPATGSDGTCACREQGNHVEGFAVTRTTSQHTLDSYPGFFLETRMPQINPRSLAPQHGEGTATGPIASDDTVEVVDVHGEVPGCAKTDIPGSLSLSLGAESYIEEGDNYVQNIYGISSGLQRATFSSTPAWLPSLQCSGGDRERTSPGALEPRDTAVTPTLEQRSAVPAAPAAAPQGHAPAGTTAPRSENTDTPFIAKGTSKGSNQGCEVRTYGNNTSRRHGRWPLLSETQKEESKAVIIRRRKSRKKSIKRELSAVKHEQGQRDGISSAEESFLSSGTYEPHLNPCAPRRRPAQDASCEKHGSWRLRSGQPRMQDVAPPSLSATAAKPSQFSVTTATRPTCDKADISGAPGAFASIALHPSTTIAQIQQDSSQERRRSGSNGGCGDIRTNETPASGRCNAVLQQLNRSSHETSKPLANQRQQSPVTNCPTVRRRVESGKSPTSKTNTCLPPSVRSSPPGTSVRRCPKWTAARGDKSYFAEGAGANNVVNGRFRQDRVLSQQMPKLPRQQDSVLDAVEQLAEGLKVLITATRCDRRETRSKTTSANVSSDRIRASHPGVAANLRQSCGGNALPPPPGFLEGGAFREPGLRAGSFTQPAPSGPNTRNTAARETSVREASCTNSGSGFGIDTSAGAFSTTCVPLHSKDNGGGHCGAHTNNPSRHSNSQGCCPKKPMDAAFLHNECVLQYDEQRRHEQQLESSARGKSNSTYTKFRYCQSRSLGVLEAPVIPPPPPPPPLPSACTVCQCDGGRNNYAAFDSHQPYPLPRYQLGMGETVHKNQNAERHREEQQQHGGSALLPYPLLLEDIPGRKNWGTNNGERIEGSPCIPAALSGSNSGMLWSTSVPPVSLLLTLPLNIPYGKILKFGSPDMVPHTSLTLPAPHPASADFSGESLGVIPSLLGNCHPLVPRALGAKKSYYCFSPQLHPGAHTLLSHAGGICDTFAASLHVELAIFYVPVPLLSAVASIFQALAPRLPHLTSPLKLNCGGLNERNAPGRFGGKVLTVSCAVSEHEERHKFQQMQDFLSVFQTKVDAVLCEYTQKQEKYLSGGGGHTAGSHSQRGTPGRGSGAGKKHNIWKYSMNCLPTSLNISSQPRNSGAPQGRSEHSSSRGASDAFAGADSKGEEEEGLNGCNKEPGGGGTLDLTIRAFESKPLDDELKEYAKTLVVPDVYVSEMRLITTHSHPGRTCELDPRFPEYCIGTRPILLGSDGKLCRHTLTNAPPLPDVWEVRLRSGDTRDMQKELVQRCMLAAVEGRPAHERHALLKAVIDAGVTMWVNGKILLTPPPPLSARNCRAELHQRRTPSFDFTKEMKLHQHSVPLCTSGLSNRPRVDITGQSLPLPTQMHQPPAPVASSSVAICHEPSREFGFRQPFETGNSKATGMASQEAERRPIPVTLHCEARDAKHGCNDGIWYGGKISEETKGNYASLGLREHNLSPRGSAVADPTAGVNTGEGTYDAESRGQESHVARSENRLHRHSPAGMQAFATPVNFFPPGLDVPQRESAVRAPAHENAQRHEPGTHPSQKTVAEETGEQQKHLGETVELLHALTSCWGQRPGHYPDHGELRTLQQNVGGQAAWNSAEGVVPSGRFNSRNTERDSPADADSVLRQLLSLAAPLHHRGQPPERQRRQDAEHRRCGNGKMALMSSRSSLATCDSSDNSPAAAAAVRCLLSNSCQNTVGRARLLDPVPGGSNISSSLTRHVVVQPNARSGHPTAVISRPVDGTSESISSPCRPGASAFLAGNPVNSTSIVASSRSQGAAGEMTTAMAAGVAGNRVLQGDALLPIPPAQELAGSGPSPEGRNAEPDPMFLLGRPHRTGSNAGLLQIIQAQRPQEPCGVSQQQEHTEEAAADETKGNEDNELREGPVVNYMQYF